MKIKKTQDYNLFRKVLGNRDLSDSHVRRLAEAFADKPELAEYSFITVNERMEVIDGQHRLEALKRLGRPVYYMTVPGLNLKDVQRLNSGSKQWRPIDYAKSYRVLGVEPYRLYLEFRAKYKLNHDVLLKYMSLKNNTSTQAFKDGKFVVKDLASAVTYCHQLVEISAHYDKATLRDWALGFLRIMGSPAYDHNRMLQKVSKHSGRFREASGEIETSREIERIYNFGKGQKVRLF